MRRQSSSIPFLWDGSIHSESASPVTPSNQIRLRSTRSDWKTRGSPWAGSPLPARASQSPEHCMAGATGQDPTLAPPPVGSCFSRGRYSGTEPTAGAAAGLCPGYRTSAPISQRGHKRAQISSSKPGQKRCLAGCRNRGEACRPGGREYLSGLKRRGKFCALK